MQNKLFSLFILFSPLFLTSQNWRVEQISTMPFETSNNAVTQAFIAGSPYIYSFTGIDNTKSYSGIHLKAMCYNVFTGASIQLADVPDTLGKIAAGASTIGDIIYIVGGYHVFEDGHEVSSNKVHRYQVSSNTYLSDAASLPVAIDDHVQAVWRDSLLYVITGWSNTTNVPDVQIYNPIEDVWYSGTPVPNTSIYKSFGASGVIVGDTIYYLGGASSSINFPAQKHLIKGFINSENPLEITWSSTLLNQPIYRGTSALVNNVPHWFGGSEVTYNYDGLAYSNGQGVSPSQNILSYSNQIDTVSSQINLPMDLRGIAKVNDNSFYILGGMNQGQQVSNAVLKISQVFSIGVEERNELQQQLFYPNPSKGLVYTNSLLKEIEVFNVSGQKVGNYLNQGGILNLSKLSDGFYFLKEGERLTMLSIQH